MKSSRRLSDETAQLAGHQILRNLEANLPRVKKALPVSALRGASTGQLAVVAGAGPSLDQAIGDLWRRRDHYFLIAVDGALRPLVAGGILPDLVVTVDHFLEGVAWFEALNICGIPLLFDPLAAPQGPAAWPGPLFTYNRPDVILDKGDMSIGTSVLPIAVGAALWAAPMGVVLSGCDLAYAKHQDHATGWKKEAKELPGTVTRRIFVPGIQGAVETDEAFRCTIEELEELVRDFRIAVKQPFPFIQTSPWGARIPGWEEMPLAEVL